MKNNRWLMGGLRVALAWLAAISAFNSFGADEFCYTCGQKLTGTVYSLARRGRSDKVFICPTCAKLDTSCYICGVPVKDKLMQLADGRLLCEADAKQAVLTQDDAEKIFDEVKRDVQSILSQLGSLPHHNIKLILEAKARLDKTGSNLISSHDDRMLMGLTRSTGRSGERLEHTIYLLYGLTRERMMAVAAHEYGHTWLHENVQRKLNQDAVEGFCDWLAWKVIREKNVPFETESLAKSDYSKGQLQAFIAAETEHSFYRVMQWVKAGIDPELDAEHLNRVLELRDQKTAFVQPAFVATPIRTGPTNLVLKGLSGSKLRRLALINDGTFEINEQGRVRLGETNVTLRCLQIHEDAVVVQVAGENGSRTLKLSPAR